MKVALIQSHIIWENKEENITRLKSDLIELCEYSLDLLLLPEMSFTGFSMNVGVTQDYNNYSCSQVVKLAKDNKIPIGFGWVERKGEKCRNHYSIVDSNGILSDYEKIHPFSYGGETDFFTGGESISFCSIRDFVIGTQICYDLRFPEVFQILSKKSSLIIVPANWPSKREKHWDILLQARAVENQVYIAGINCMGEMNGMYYSGHSMIYSPDGSQCDYIKIDLNSGNCAFIFNLINDVDAYRCNFPLKNDRRENLYRDLSLNGV